MFIFIILYEVFSFNLPKETYILRQNDSSLFYQIILNDKFYDVDLNTEFSVIGNDFDSALQNQERLQCDTYYQCQYCQQYCGFTYFDTQNNENNGTLLSTTQQVKNYQNDKIIEEFVSLHSENTYIIGLGARRTQSHNNFIYPQNPFISEKFSICFGNIGYFHRKVQQDFGNSINLQYSQIENYYVLQFQSLRLSQENIVNLDNINITFDSLNPYTQVPEEIFKFIYQYYKSQGFSLIGQNIISIHQSKFKLENLQPIKLYINQTFYIVFQPQDFLYYKGNYIELPFKKSNKMMLILGITFLQNIYLSIDQNSSLIIISQRNCQADITDSFQYTKYVILILILIITIVSITIFIKYCKKAKLLKRFRISNNFENTMELPTQESQRNIDIQDQIESQPKPIE